MNTKFLSLVWRAFSMIYWVIAIPSIVSISCFYFGYWYYNACPLEPTLLRNFVIFGVFILILNIIALILVVENSINYPGDHEATGIALVMTGYIFLFIIGALIMSFFVIFKLDVNYPENNLDCHPSVYTFANIFVTCTVGLVLLFLFVCLKCYLRR